VSREGGQRSGGTQIAVMEDEGLESLNDQIVVAENEGLEDDLIDYDDLERAEELSKTLPDGNEVLKNSMLS
jgi:hypothetical protein